MNEKPGKQLLLEANRRLQEVAQQLLVAKNELEKNAKEREHLLKIINKEKKDATKKLKMTESKLDNLMNRQQSVITAQAIGVGSIQQRLKKTFKKLCNEYEKILDLYMENLVVNGSFDSSAISHFANKIGDFWGSARDVIDIHVYSVKEKCKKASPKRAIAFATEGRLLALELMGYLADYYRAEITISATQTKERK